ncbi:MAG: hypothetical protein ACREL9_12185 [Gemmatimonadales bacterium]
MYRDLDAARIVETARVLHQRRSLAHIVDMHQLTKDPSTSSQAGRHEQVLVDTGPVGDQPRPSWAT